ncbi:MAG: YbjN domain-containing protein [Micropepsaceae bacterium]
MRKSLLAAAAAVHLAAAASAADVITAIKSDRLAEIVTALTGKKATIEKPEAGVEVVTISDDGDMDFIMSDCTAKGCSTLQPTMFFNKDDQFNLTVVNGYNSKQLGAQAFLTPDNRAYLVTLYLFDGGVTEENVKAKIVLYLKTPGIFVEHVIGSQTTASAPAGTVPAAAPSTAATTAGTGAQASEPQRSALIERVTAGHKGRSLR